MLTGTALIHLSRLAAVDLAPRIRVNVIAPGSIDTDALSSVLSDDMRHTMTAMTPAHRLGTAEDVAAAVVYLASDAGAFLTGKVLEVGGGLGRDTYECNGQNRDCSAQYYLPLFAASKVDEHDHWKILEWYKETETHPRE